MLQVRVEAESRSETGKGSARSLRRDGKLPAVVYGFGEPASLIQLNAHDFNLAITKQRAEHALINLSVDGGDTSLAIVKLVQRDPVRHHLLHIDFQAIRMDQPITVSAQIILDGEPAGVEQGGVLEFSLREVEIHALPQDVPDSIHVDVSGLAVGDSIHISDLVVADGVSILTDPEILVAAVAIPRVMEVETEDEELEEGEEREPERVGEDDDDESDDD